MRKNIVITTLLNFTTLIKISSFYMAKSTEIEGYFPSRETRRILSISGGGMQGIMPLVTLAWIEELSGKRTCELFDLIGGTSIGAVIAALLTLPKSAEDKTPKYSAKEILDLLIQEKNNLFKKRSPYLSAIFGSAYDFMGPVYDKASLIKVADRLFAETTFQQALIPTVATTTVKKTLEAKIIRSWDKKEPYLTKDVILASSAAPYFFPSHTLRTTDGKSSVEVIDGGVNANNPTAYLMKEAKILFGEDLRFEVVHLGTGDCQDSLFRRAWNLIPFNPLKVTKVIGGIRNNFVDFYIKLQHYLTDKGMELIHTGDYLALNPIIRSHHLGVDNICSTNISRLKQITQDYLAEQIEKILTIIQPVGYMQNAVLCLEK